MDSARLFKQGATIMKIIASVIILSLSSVAFATGDKKDDQSQDQRQYQDQEQYQGQHQGQDQYQDQTAIATSNISVNVGGGTDAEGNAVPMATAQGGSLTFNEAKRPDDITIRNTVSARVPNLVATSPCFYSWSGGVGGAGFNIGGGKAKRDEECDKRELARMIAGFGYNDIAMAIACQTQAAIDTIGELCAGMVRSTDRVTQLTAENARLREEIERDKVDCNDANNRVFAACKMWK
jgi:hypothetical protein